MLKIEDKSHKIKKKEIIRMLLQKRFYNCVNKNGKKERNPRKHGA
jgi:hypothetical protein